jgi:hypothetical protein
MHLLNGRALLTTGALMVAGASLGTASASAARVASPSPRLVMAVTSPAVAVTSSRAVLAGRVRAKGADVKYYFRFGTGRTLERRTRVGRLVWPSRATRVFVSVAGLKAHRTYRFRLVVNGARGASAGRTMDLVTPTRRRHHKHSKPAVPVTKTPATTTPVLPPASSTDPFQSAFPSATTAADPSGQPMPVGDLPGWHQVFSDDFTTDVPIGGFSGCNYTASVMTDTCSGLPPAVQSKWWAYPDGWPDTGHNGQYYPSQDLSIQNGVLDQYIHTANGIHMVSAAVPKIPGGVGGDGGLQYGAYVVRFRSDILHGYKTAWLLWPDSNIWPAQGEIDFPEGDLDSTFSGYMHWMNGTAGAGAQQDAYSTTAHYASWHTAVIEWTPAGVSFVLDGHLVGSSTQKVPSDPMHWVLQTETAIDGTTPSNTESGHVQIDWVSVYTPTAG